MNKHQVMKTRRAAVAAATVGAVVLASGSAQAQIDINQPIPNLLLMLDTSGSMEYMADGTMPAVCDVNQASDLNRWGSVIEVLTGSLQGRGCYLQDRSTANFDSEYSIQSNSPYDLNYFLPYHRYTSNGCLMTPGTLPSSVFNWNPDPVEQREWNDYTFNGNPGTCNSGNVWTQNNDGLLDTYRDRVRFSTFMFDSLTDEGIGFQGSAFRADGITGHWSYFDGWQSGPSSILGGPPNCTPTTFEVGARNFAAPPWEGRMIPFGESQAPIADIRTTNSRIQETIASLRPFGATPLGGMFSDAWVYFHQDTSDFPGPTPGKFAPAGDPLFTGGCRESYIMLLSDGEPNLDLRPECTTGNGTCPYRQPWEYAQDLANPPNPDHTVKTFVVGFGVSSGSGFDCTTLNMPADLGAGQPCDNPTGPLAACCTLARVAYEGGTSQAYFADDASSLAAAIAAVFDQIATNSTSRTLPVIASATASQASNSLAPAVSYEFGSSFVPEPGELWKGELERKRWECVLQSGNLVPTLQTVDDTKGDDFAENVNIGKATTPRTFITVVGDTVSGDVRSRGSIRPNLGADDGLGLYNGTTYTGDTSTISSAMGSNPDAMGITASPLPSVCSTSELNASSDTQCAQRLMTWQTGGNNGSGLATRDGNEFGAVYHSNPTVIGQPAAFIRDPSYERFANLQTLRPLVLYTATVDGQMHAFKIATNDPSDSDESDTLDNNELWAFMPPHVLKGISSQFPGTPTLLLDGAPVVKDIPFERSLAQAIDGGTATGADWRTVLVAGGGLGGGFYYALDVTDPYNPTFLWQISNDADDDALFGPASGQPAVTTITLEENSVVKEVAVAILPGGQGTRQGSGSSHCHRVLSNFNHISGSYSPHTHVKCWNEEETKSVTVVRLSNGEVIKRFVKTINSSGSAQLQSAKVQQFDFDAPILTATPFPNTTGQVSNRAYLGDQDGTLWRLDLSDPDPAQWQMHIMFDAYSFPNDNNSGGSYTGTGEPIPVAPTVSVDGTGNTVLVFATGDQEDFESTDIEGRVWSITEYPEVVGGVPFRVEPNWVLGDPVVANGTLDAGEHVFGPISVFDGVAYFSTFTAPVSNTSCDNGRGRIWAVDFIEPKPTTPGPEPEPRFPDGVGGFKYNPDQTDSASLAGDPTIFGVAVAPEPACVEEQSSTDDYVGQHTTLAQSVPPVFKLRFHTGADGTANSGSTINTGELTVPQPRTQGFIDSWASVVE
jgi:type IV pilus assembly protein PilY1